MSDSRTSAGDLGCFGVCVMVAIAILGWIVDASIRAQAFNSATGKHVTTWDAMFIELRVDAPPKD
jgi:hypothetical protein